MRQKREHTRKTGACYDIGQNRVILLAGEIQWVVRPVIPPTRQSPHCGVWMVAIVSVSSLLPLWGWFSYQIDGNWCFPSPISSLRFQTFFFFFTQLNISMIILSRYLIATPSLSKAVIKTPCPKAAWAGKGIPGTIMQGTQGRNLETGADTEVMEGSCLNGLFLMDCSVCFLIAPRTTCPWVVLPTVNWTIPH